MRPTFTQKIVIGLLYVIFGTGVFDSQSVNAEGGYVEARKVENNFSTTIFLQYNNEQQNINFFTNQYKDTVNPVTELIDFEGTFSLWEIETQTRHPLDSPHVTRFGNIYTFEKDGKEFIFTLNKVRDNPNPGKRMDIVIFIEK